MGLVASSSRSSKKLLEFLVPNSRAKLITEDNQPIKGLFLGISNISDLSSSIPGYGKDIVHVAFFLTTQNTFQNKGIILDYGAYDYIKDERLAFEYNEEGGLRFGYIEYQQFLKDAGKAAMVKLDLSHSRPIRFNDLIDKVKKNNSWKQKDYSNLSHNCQNFAVEIIKILNPRYCKLEIMPGENASLIEGKDEQEIIPSVILKQLKKNMA